MRIWDIDPGFLNDKSLLGEHRELHGLMSIYMNHKKGYARHPETLRWENALTGLFLRHEIIVQEMGLRGFNHHSPLEALKGRLCWPDRYLDSPAGQIKILRDKYQDLPPGQNQGRIPLPRNTQQLWATHKYSIMARNPENYKQIGPAVAQKALGFDELSLELVKHLRTPPRQGRLVNALEHMWGYVSQASSLNRKDLSPQTLLSEIRCQVQTLGTPYLLHSTALGELGAWVYPNVDV